jgi:hydrogenase nickel incorporation protein HypB
VPFDIETAVENARRVHPRIEIVKISSLTGNGFDAWITWLAQRRKVARLLAPAG